MNEKAEKIVDKFTHTIERKNEKILVKLGKFKRYQDRNKQYEKKKNLPKWRKKIQSVSRWRMHKEEQPGAKETKHFWGEI